MNFVKLYIYKEADYYMSTSLATAYRLPKVDYPAAWTYWPFGILLPYPKESINLAASLEPLPYEVLAISSV